MRLLHFLTFYINVAHTGCSAVDLKALAVLASQFFLASHPVQHPEPAPAWSPRGQRGPLLRTGPHGHSLLRKGSRRTMRGQSPLTQLSGHTWGHGQPKSPRTFSQAGRALPHHPTGLAAPARAARDGLNAFLRALHFSHLTEHGISDI